MSSGARPSSHNSNLDDLIFQWDDAAVREHWLEFAKFGNASATEMTGKNFDKWLKDANVLDQKNITTTMTGINFAKVTGPKRKTLTFEESKEVLAKLCAERAQKSKKSVQEELDTIVNKLESLEMPSVGAATRPAKTDVVDRLTDPSKYTGSHVHRFDESGKGKGKSGREDVKDESGYVAGYKNKDTYEKTHGK